MAEDLNSGLSESDKRAAVVLEKYLESYNNVESSSLPLAWTNFYRKKDKLEAVCRPPSPLGLGSAAAESSDKCFDWLRIVCYVLDQRRLRCTLKAKEVNSSCQPLSKKRLREDEENILSSGSQKLRKRMRLSHEQSEDSENENESSVIAGSECRGILRSMDAKETDRKGQSRLNDRMDKSIEDPNDENEENLNSEQQCIDKRVRKETLYVQDEDDTPFAESSSTELLRMTDPSKSTLLGITTDEDRINIHTPHKTEDHKAEDYRTEGHEKGDPFKSNCVFIWSFKVAEMVQLHLNSFVELCQISNAILIEIADDVIDKMEWFGVYNLPTSSSLDHTSDSLLSLLESLSTSVAVADSVACPVAVSNSTEASDESTVICIHQENNNPHQNPYSSVYLQSDQIILSFRQTGTQQKSIGQWRNPTFVEWLTQGRELHKMKAEMKIKQPSKSWTINGYSPSGQTANGYVIFILGIFSFVSDVLEELWGRVRAIVSSLGNSTDYLQEVRLLANAPSLKFCCTSNGVDMLRLFDEIQCLLGISKLPRDIQIGVTLSLEHLKIAQKEWQEIHRQNEEKRIIAEEEEKVKRNAASQEAARRDQQRREIVEFIKEGVRLDEQSREKNPFWILGVDPQTTTDALLMKMKRKLSLILHPDKCSDLSYKGEVQEAFLGVNTAISSAKELLTCRRHLSLKAAPLRHPPYAELLDLPQRHQPQTQPKPSTGTTKQSSKNGNTNPDFKPPSNSAEKTAEPPIKLTTILASELAGFLKHRQKTFQHASSKIMSPEVVQISFSRRGLFLRISALESHHYIRVFLSRPMQSGVQFIAKFNSFANGTHNEYSMGAIHMCSGVWESNGCLFDLQNASLDPQKLLQPVHESIRESSVIILAVQSIDGDAEKASLVKYLTVPYPYPFKIPSQKPRIIESIQSFYYAPAEYNVGEILEEELDATFNYEYFDPSSFPTAPTLNGKYSSQLRCALESLIIRAGKVEFS